MGAPASQTATLQPPLRIGTRYTIFEGQLEEKRWLDTRFSLSGREESQAFSEAAWFRLAALLWLLCFLTLPGREQPFHGMDP
jgi:hypothetical protein